MSAGSVDAKTRGPAGDPCARDRGWFPEIHPTEDGDRAMARQWFDPPGARITRSAE